MRPSAALLALVLFGCGPASPADAGSTLDASRDGDGGGDAGADAGGDGEADGGGDAGADGGPGPEVLTVLSLNLRCLRVDGTPYADNEARFAGIASSVASERVDVLLLQEVCDDGVTDAAAALRGAIAEAGGGAFESQVAFAHVAWEGTPEEARESVAVLARTIERPTELSHRDQGSLRRVTASADVASVLGRVRVASVHLDHLDETIRRSQARDVAVVATSEADPSLSLLIGGDLNARVGTGAHAALGAAGFIDASASLDADRIDHVFVHRGAPLRVLEARLVFDGAATRVSDHPGVLVRFGAAAPPPILVTRVVAEHDPGLDRHLWIRGSAAPLDWSAGWPMHALAPGRWRWVCTELEGVVELKALIGDTTWQLGANEVVAAGSDLSITPSF